MTRIHFAALSERWSSAENHDASVAEKIGDFYLFGVAEGLSDEPGRTSASSIAISSLIDSVRKMKGSPAAALNTAVRESEEMIHAQMAKSPESSRNATHLSACIVSDALECTVLDTGEGNVLLLGPDGIVVPRDHPIARYPPDMGIAVPVTGREKQSRDMIAHTLGEPHTLKQFGFCHRQYPRSLPCHQLGGPA